MKRTKWLFIHFILVVVLLLIGFFIFGTHSIGEVSALTGNRERRILQIAVSLIFFFWCYKMMLYMNELFSMKHYWMFLTDFGVTAMFARLFETIFNRRNDLALQLFGRPIDFFDLCVGVGVAGLLLFAIKATIVWYKIRREYLENATAWEKFCWEWKMSFLIFRAMFVSEKELSYDLQYLAEKSKENWFHKDI